MKDIIVDCVGALAMSILGYIDIKANGGKLDKYLIRIKKIKAADMQPLYIKRITI